MLGQLRNQHHQQHRCRARAWLQGDEGDRQQRLQHGNDRAEAGRQPDPAVHREQQQEGAEQQRA